MWQVIRAVEWVAGGQPQAAPSALFWGLAALDPSHPKHRVARKTCHTRPVGLAIILPSGKRSFLPNGVDNGGGTGDKYVRVSRLPIARLEIGVMGP